MTNAEKYKEVFGYDVKENLLCGNTEFNEDNCKYCLERHQGVCGCKPWKNAEYKERE